MSKIVKNTTASPVFISDVGITILANSSYTISPSEYPLWATSSDIVLPIGNGTLVINDGSFDLSIAEGIGLIQGSFIRKITGFDSDLLASNRLKVDVTGLSSDNIVEGSNNLFFTNERAQDAVGAALTDSSSLDLSYNDSLNTISGVVLPAGVDHNSLQNYQVNNHIDHTAVSILPGTGLSGGGDISSSRTLNIANTGVTAGTYGSSTQSPVFQVNDQGQITSVTNTEIFSNILEFQTNSATTVSTTSTTFQNLIFLTPGIAGTYVVFLTVDNSTTSDGYGEIDISVAGVSRSNSVRRFGVDTVTFLGASSDSRSSNCTSAVVTITASDTITGRYRSVANSVSCNGRQLIAIKVG